MLANNVYFVIIALSLNFCVCKKYTNYSLYRAVPVNKSHLNFLLSLNQRYDIIFWRAPGNMYRAVDFVINPKDQQEFLKDAKKHKVYLTEIMSDVQSAFDQQKVRQYFRRQMNSMNWHTYYRLNDIYTWLSDLSKAYPREVELQSIGKSHENREILAVRVVLRGSLLRSTIMIEGGIHGREWISPAFVTYLINSIVHAKSSNNDAWKDIARTYEWYFVPVLNPDGYEYSHTKDRLWRKNRHGYGIDLNRNFGFGFGTLGVDWNKDSDVYCGPHAFSEKESKAMAALVKAKSGSLEYYISFHSYGQYMVIPYGHSVVHLGNYAEVYNMCKLAAQQIYAKYRTAYDVGTSFETVGYKSSGVSTCWVKKTYNVPYVVIIELRDGGQYGFALPPEKILPTCIETLDGLVSFFSPKNRTVRSPYKSYISGQPYKILDQIVFVCNVLLFIIVRFD